MNETEVTVYFVILQISDYVLTNRFLRSQNIVLPGPWNTGKFIGRYF